MNLDNINFKLKIARSTNIFWTTASNDLKSSGIINIITIYDLN